MQAYRIIPQFASSFILYIDIYIIYRYYTYIIFYIYNIQYPQMKEIMKYFPLAVNLICLMIISSCIHILANDMTSSFLKSFLFFEIIITSFLPYVAPPTLSHSFLCVNYSTVHMTHMFYPFFCCYTFRLVL